MGENEVTHRARRGSTSELAESTAEADKVRRTGDRMYAGKHRVVIVGGSLGGVVSAE